MAKHRNTTTEHTGITDEQNRQDMAESGLQPSAHINDTAVTAKPKLSKEERRDVSAQRFRKLAMNRVPRLLKLMDMVRNLSNKSVYYYEKQQADKIVNTVETAFKALKLSFEGVKEIKDAFII